MASFARTVTAASAAAVAQAAFPTKLTLGTDYYPEAWDPSLWATDAAAMQAAGISVVRLAEFAWHSFQPNSTSPYQFAWLDDALTVLAAHNISAIVGTPTASPPSWLIASDPTMQMVDQNGVLYRYGSRQNVNHLHPGFRTATQNIVTAIGQHYANDPRVVGFQLDNEIHGDTDYSSIALAAWQQWLAAAYGSVDALNAAWGTVFWSHTYNTWQDVPLPWNTIDGAHNPGMSLDYRRFLSFIAVDYMTMQADILRAVAPSKLITSNLMGTYQAVDYGKLGAILDLAAWDNYPMGTGQGWWPNATGNNLYGPTVGAACTRGANVRGSNANGQAPFYVMEQQASNDGQAVYYGAAYPEATRMFAWQQVANGADGVQFFRWRTTRVGFEQHWEGILDWDGSTDNPKYPNVVRMGQEFAKASAAVVGRSVRAKVALLVSSDTRWALQDQPLTNPGFDVRPQLTILTNAFRSNKQGVDVVYVPSEADGSDGTVAPAPGINLSEYDIVLAPTLFVVPQWLADTLTAYVANGGHLLLTMRSGSKNAANQYTNQTLPSLLAGIAGVQIKSWDPMCSLGTSSVVYGGGTYAVSTSQGRICDVLSLVTAQSLFFYASGYYQGKPAVTHNVYGPKGGSVVYSGIVSDEVQFYEALGQFLASDAGLAWGPRLPDGVEVSIREVPGSNGAPGATTVFVLNFNSVPMTVTVPEAAGGTDVLSGSAINGQGLVNLGPYDLAVVQV